MGSTRLSANTLGQYAGELAQWGTHLTADADILFYGCDIAGNAAGRQLLEDISLLTGADVAASDDLTGAKSLGGDWELETQIGPVAAPLALTELGIVVTGVIDASTEVVEVGGEAFTLNANQTVTTTVGGTSLSVAYVASTQTFTVSPAAGAEMTIPTTDLTELVSSLAFRVESASPTAGNRVLTLALKNVIGQSATADSTITVLPVNTASTVQLQSLSPRDVVVVVDLALQDVDQLLAGIPAGTTVVLIPIGTPGIAGLANALVGLQDIAALHILSHGTPGTFSLGTDLLTNASINGIHAANLQRIGAALTPGADILVYGCEFGQNATAVVSLANQTGADIAASSDKTGVAALGGDDVLEIIAGDQSRLRDHVRTAPLLLIDEHRSRPSVDLGNGQRRRRRFEHRHCERRHHSAAAGDCGSRLLDARGRASLADRDLRLHTLGRLADRHRQPDAHDRRHERRPNDRPQLDRLRSRRRPRLLRDRHRRRSAGARRRTDRRCSRPWRERHHSADDRHWRDHRRGLRTSRHRRHGLPAQRERRHGRHGRRDELRHLLHRRDRHLRHRESHRHTDRASRSRHTAPQHHLREHRSRPRRRRPHADDHRPRCDEHHQRPAVATITVVPVNDPPVALDDTFGAAPEDNSVTITPKSNDSDVDSDPLFITHINGTPILPGDAAVVVANGLVSLSPDGTQLIFSPNENDFGPVNFEYTLDDHDGGTDTAVISGTITSVNDVPVAVDDAFITAEDTPVATTVLTNDSDIEAGPLSVMHVGGLSIVAGGAAVLVLNGSVTLSLDGLTLLFTPAPDFNGPVDFTDTISDGAGGTDTATVNGTIEPANDAPIAIDDDFITDEDDSSSIAILANDSESSPTSMTSIRRTS